PATPGHGRGSGPLLRRGTCDYQGPPRGGERQDRSAHGLARRAGGNGRVRPSEDLRVPDHRGAGGSRTVPTSGTLIPGTVMPSRGGGARRARGQPIEQEG